MKFSHSLRFNAVPDWSSHYIAYSNLKKLVYNLQKQVQERQEHAGNNVEASPLLNATPIDTDTIFRRALDKELEKIYHFYQEKEDKIFLEADNISEQHELRGSQTPRALGGDSGHSSRRGSIASFNSRFGAAERHHTADPEHDAFSDNENEEDSDADDDMGSVSGLQYRPSLSLLESQTTNVYVSLCELKSFIQLNRTGFSKVLKKYDKTLDRDLRRIYLNTAVAKAYPFEPATAVKIDSHLSHIEQLYAKMKTNGNTSLARRELRLHLREHVVWERNTVWREMIGIERKAQAAYLGRNADTVQRQGDEQETPMITVRTPLGKLSVPRWVLTPTLFTLIVSIILFFCLLSIPIMKRPEQQNCLALLVFVSLLWATEVIPLFVTSLLIPFLVVVLGVLKDDHGVRLSAPVAAKQAFASMWTPVIMLLLGGFGIAAALSKHDIARRMAVFVLSKAGTRPRVVLITNMYVSLLLSMWISNVAAPILSFSIILPLIKNLPPDSDFSKAVVLGIALSANVGGLASPIASPQNLIALQNMDPAPSWGTWFFISLPISIVAILLIWALLIVTFRVNHGVTIPPVRPVKEPFSGIQWFVMIVTFVTIAFWCVSHALDNIFGDMGIIALVPLVVFFGTGILTKEDFNNFLWTIIILASGGLCLGHAVTSSGLLHTMATEITAGLRDLSPYGLFIALSFLVLVVATFISHTVAALIMLPLVKQIGYSFEGPVHPNALVMGCALIASVAMALPTSGFPNMTAIMMEVPETGIRYLNVRHFLTRGVAATLLSYGVVVTIGYGLIVVANI